MNKISRLILWSNTFDNNLVGLVIAKGKVGSAPSPLGFLKGKTLADAIKFGVTTPYINTIEVEYFK